MDQQGEIEGFVCSPSFSFYTSDTSTSMAIAKVIRRLILDQQGEIEGFVCSPSFSFYTSDTSTSMAIAKVIREEQGVDFRFSVDLREEGVSAKEIDSRGWTVFPFFNHDLLIKDEVKSKDNEIHASDSITNSLWKLFIDEPEESSSCSSSEADELEALPSGTFYVWRPKTEGGSSPVMTKIKKSKTLIWWG
uniref:Uncharacterized protein n=1 Tax=Lactuca sativa TaxID=4236 RepID=A0A9R1V867_LACSA|nr:hypothetical protein LSAT_V11C600325730 [Lactuca sativa]